MVLYALLDVELLEKENISFEEFLIKAKEKDAKLIQYRDKKNDLYIKKLNIDKIKKLLKKLDFKVKLIVNDNIELLNYVDGIHLGQEDILSFGFKQKNKAIEFIRFNYPNKIIGLSTKNKEQVLEANNLDLDYIGLGAYRETSTKTNAKVLENFEEIASLSSHHVGAIGGVRFDDDIKNVTFYVIGSGLLKD